MVLQFSYILKFPFVKTFPRSITDSKKKKNQPNMSFLSSVMIESAYKNHDFRSLSKIFDFSLWLYQIFFSRKLFKDHYEQNKKELRKSTRMVASLYKNSTGKALSVFTEFFDFPGNFSNFLSVKTLFGPLQTFEN